MRKLYLNSYANGLGFFLFFLLFLFFLPLALLALMVWVYSVHFVIAMALFAGVPPEKFALPSTKDYGLRVLVNYYRFQINCFILWMWQDFQPSKRFSTSVLWYSLVCRTDFWPRNLSQLRKTVRVEPWGQKSFLHTGFYHNTKVENLFEDQKSCHIVRIK